MWAIAKLDVRPLGRILKALGDETRLRIVALLSHGPLCVCHLGAALALTQSNTSRQLAVLRAAGVVEARRQGTWVFYELAPQADPLCRDQLSALVGSFEKRALLRKDIQRLLKMKGPNACR